MLNVVWSSDERFAVGDVEFRTVGLGTGRIDSTELWVHKSKAMVDSFVADVRGFAASRIVELGIKGGGSTAMLAQLFDPTKLVALDITPDLVPSLESFRESEHLTDRVRPYYGVDQADRVRLAAIVDDEFAGEALDLVIDDASHLPVPSRASFEVLFPRLRDGGRYVIEDWAWEHAFSTSLRDAIGDTGDAFGAAQMAEVLVAMGWDAETFGPLQAGQLMSDFVVEVLVAKADPTSGVGDIVVRPDVVVVGRGSGAAVDGVPGGSTETVRLATGGVRADDARGEVVDLLGRLGPASVVALDDWRWNVSPASSEPEPWWVRVSPLLHELVLVVAEGGGVIDELRFGRERLDIRRGPSTISASGDLADLYRDTFGALSHERLESAYGTEPRRRSDNEV